MKAVVLLLFALIPSCCSLDNGLALTPPMGWLTWVRFLCETDCVNHPTTCISENLMKEMADIMASEGYLEAGYQYVNVDDCWLAPTRDSNGRLQPDPQRFPSGIKALADYIHSKGLKFGIYEDYGTKTCAGFPGSLYNMELDAQTFAEWGVDYVKFDGCNSDVLTMYFGYPAMGRYLNATGRPMVYSCEWPMYEVQQRPPNMQKVAETCNLWRLHTDIEDSWESLSDFINWFGDNQDTLIPIAGPGHFNDPDQIVVGNSGLNEAQSRVQMALWAIFAAPMIMSNDLRSLHGWQKRLLLNKNVIAINQDPLGIHGRRTIHNGATSVWVKELTGSQFAVAILNQADQPLTFSMTLYDMGIQGNTLFSTVETFEGGALGNFNVNDRFICGVEPTGVFLFTAKAVGNKSAIKGDSGKLIQNNNQHSLNVLNRGKGSRRVVNL